MYIAWGAGVWVKWGAMRADLHVDTLWRLEEKGGGLSPRREQLQVDASRCKQGSVGLLCTAVFTEDDRADPWNHGHRLLDVRDRLHSEAGEPFEMVVDPVQLEALEESTTGMLATIENGRCLEGDLARLDLLHERGVRILGVTWNGANELGQGVMEDDHEGLTRFGKDAVRHASELGWAIDVTHLNREGVIDVYQSGAPMLATHSNSRTLHEHPRNLSDELLQLIADRGGMVGVNVFPPFLAPAHETVNLDTVARHVLHLMEFLGQERVGLGTDLDGISKFPVDFRDHRDLDRLAQALVQAGVSTAGVDSVLGDGFINWWKTWSVDGPS